MINRAHPLGPPKPNGPIIAHVPWDTDISKILGHIKKLRGTEIYIDRNYTKEVREKRSRLRAIMKKIKEKNNALKMKLVFDSLLVESVKYSWDWRDGLKCEKDYGMNRLKMDWIIDLNFLFNSSTNNSDQAEVMDHSENINQENSNIQSGESGRGYKLYTQAAVRFSNFGRASGGWLCGVNHKIQHKLREVNGQMIIDIKVGNEKVSIIPMYLRPGEYWEECFENVERVLVQNSDQNVENSLVVGDLSARLGEEGILGDELDEDRVYRRTSLSERRVSKDKSYDLNAALGVQRVQHLNGCLSNDPFRPVVASVPLKVGENYARRRINYLPDENILKRKASYDKLEKETYKKKTCSEAVELLDYLEDLGKQFSRFTGLIQEFPNTPRPIKELYRNLIKRHALQKMEHFKKWLQINSTEPIEKMMVDTDTQVDADASSVAQKPATTECGTQTDAWHGTPRAVRVTSLEGVNNFADFQRHSFYDWPEKVFKKTTIEVLNPLDSKCNVKVVVLEPNDPKMMFSVQRLYRDRYPDLPTLEGDFEVLENSTTVKRGGERRTKVEKVIQLSSSTPEQLWHALERVRDEIKQEDSVALHHVSYMQVVELRKMAEVIFTNTKGTTVQIFTTATRREKPTYGFIVSKKDSTYSQLLEGVEKAVGDTQAKEAIRSLRSTRDGNLLITIDKDQGAASMIKNAIANKESGLTAKLVGTEKQAIIHLRGMTANTEEEHIKLAIQREIGKWKTNFAIKQIRPMRNNTKAATFILTALAARQILDLGHLKVGLARCEVERRYVVRKCQRCWSYQHDVARCDGPDRTGLCHRCGKEGHTFNTCKEDEHCVVCNEQHRIGSGKCAAFREALQRARMAEQNKNIEAPPPQAHQPPPTTEVTSMEIAQEVPDINEVNLTEMPTDPSPSSEELRRVDEEVFNGAVHSTLMEQFSSLCDSAAGDIARVKPPIRSPTPSPPSSDGDPTASTPQTISPQGSVIDLCG
ncbi:unnamed protein product [Diabrotica balteata]|uniref:CCHC-type domain-containing protein n=1 Tax=Diabrotica balteata TaxID=107213 RepID=A0A9N9TAP5_DIABA|nr:unnamed protein product [Diabrotica balteata]